MKTLLLFLLLTSLSSFQKDDKVYICKGGSAYAYHKTKDCRFLLQCTHTIVAVEIKEAKTEYKRSPCKPCYK